VENDIIQWTLSTFWSLLVRWCTNKF